MKDSRHVEILQELDRKVWYQSKSSRNFWGDRYDHSSRSDWSWKTRSLFVYKVGPKKKSKILGSFSVKKIDQYWWETKHCQKKCADLIENGDTVFIGSGTTTDFIGDYLKGKLASSPTPCLFFEKLKDFPELWLDISWWSLRVKTQTLSVNLQ